LETVISLHVQLFVLNKPYCWFE